MKEEYLHYLFKSKQLGSQFKTSNGDSLEIIDFGEHNLNAGPDFLDAKIKLNGFIWAGAIEFHVNASDWYKHKHQFDPAYNAVIAHFVYEHDQEIQIGRYTIPTVQLKPLINPTHFERYGKLVNFSEKRVVCSAYLTQITQPILAEQKKVILDERLWKKAVEIITLIEKYKGDRKKAFYVTLSKVFGGKVNALPFTMLMEQINLNWIGKLNNDSIKLEAILLGKSGLLVEDEEETYLKQLKKEYGFLKQKFGLKEMNKSIWKYSRMYPSSFPDIRIVQFANFLIKSIDISALIDEPLTKETKLNLQQISLNNFWKTHYRIGHKTAPKPVQLSASFVNQIIINVIVPFKYAIGIWEGNSFYTKNATEELKKIPAENNNIIRSWKQVGLSVKSAYDSQSLLEQKKERCNRKKCLFCGIGQHILKT